MARKAQLVTEEQFKNLVVQYTLNLKDEQLEDIGIDSECLSDVKNGNIFPLLHNLVMDDLLTKVSEDWQKVDFDLENLYLNQADYSGSEWQLGFQQLGTGFTYIGVMAGGDWEHPVYAIIYHDGKAFRGYVPTKGNTFNPVTKTAFGSEHAELDDADDEVELRRKGLIALGIPINGNSEDDIDNAYQLLGIDNIAIRKDIESRILLEGEYTKLIDLSKLDKLIDKVKEAEIAEQKSYEEKVANYRNTSVVYVADGKSEYKEVISVYEYKHMVDAAKALLNSDMTLSDFVEISEKSDSVEELIAAANRMIMNKAVKEAAKKLFGED